jgi:hypothetical protein
MKLAQNVNPGKNEPAIGDGFPRLREEVSGTVSRFAAALCVEIHTRRGNPARGGPAEHTGFQAALEGRYLDLAASIAAENPSRATCVAQSSRVFATTQSSKLWKFHDATKSSRRALNLAPIRHGYCRWLHTRGLSMASKRTEIAIEKIIAACDGNIQGALEALLLVNEYLPFRDPSLRCGWRGRRLLYTAFAETCRAFRRIDFAPQLRWLLDPLQPGAITGGADSFGQNFTRLFHHDQSLK